MLNYYVHVFRNALTAIIDTQSHRLCHEPRWPELNAFPLGSCDLANNMLALYLREQGYNPKIIWCRNDLADYPEILSHVWVEVDDKFVDITISQFPRLIRERVHIVNKFDPGILNDIYFHCRGRNQTASGSEYPSQQQPQTTRRRQFEERDVDLRNALGNGEAIYQAVRERVTLLEP